MMQKPQKIVAIHGAGMSAASWDFLSEKPETLSLPGHGDGGESLSSIEDMARWVTAKIGKDPVLLMGHSMGALVALEAADNPSVAGLILLGAAAAMPVNADLLKTAADDPEKAAGLVLKWGVFSGNPAADDIRAKLKKTAHPAALGRDLQACNAYRAGTAAAAKVNKPVLIIAGAEDKMTGADDARALAGMISGAQISILPGCGHMMFAEKPVEVSDLMRRFSTALPRG